MNRIVVLGLLLCVQLDAAGGWRRQFLTQDECPGGLGAVDEKGDLWLVCGANLPYAFSGGKLSWSSRIVHIGSDGGLLSNQEFRLTLPGAKGSVGLIALAANRARVEMVAGVEQWEGRVRENLAAYFVSIRDGQVSTPVRIAGEGQQFLSLASTPDGGFIAGGDQDPLTLVKLDPDGKPVWRKTLSSELSLPELAVRPNGDIFATGEMDGVTVWRLNQQGALLHQIHIQANQGTVAAGPGGHVAVMHHLLDDRNQVFVTGMTEDLKRLWTVSLPLSAQGGREYQIVPVPDGYAVLGRTGLKQLCIELDQSGKVLQQTEWERRRGFELFAAPSGYYLLTFGPEGVDVTLRQSAGIVAR